MNGSADGKGTYMTPEHIAQLVAFLEQRFREHYDCEDCWYSCPKAESYCGNQYEGVPKSERVCQCGYDEAQTHIARLKAAI